MVAMLAADGWMAVGVIHQPDQHGDKRNFHIHVDAYDRPAKWMDEEGKITIKLDSIPQSANWDGYFKAFLHRPKEERFQGLPKGDGYEDVPF